MPDLNFLMKKPLIFLSSFFLVLGLISCEDPAKSEARRKEASHALSNREIKRVTEQQLLDLAIKEGNDIARVIQKDLSRSVNQALTDKKINSKDDFHLINQLVSLDTLTKQYEAKIQMFSFTNTTNTPSENQLSTLKQYQEGSIPMSPKTEMLSDEEVLYTSPIILDAKPRGMWSVIFTKKFLVYKMDVKAFH